MKLIKNPQRYEQIIQNRIDQLQKDILRDDFTMQQCADLLQAVEDYLDHYEDETLVLCANRLSESVYWLNVFLEELDY